MRSRSVTVVGLTAAVTLVLLFQPLSSLAAGPESWQTGPPGSASVPWFVPVGVALLAFLGVALLTASAIHHRRLRRELRWAARETAVAPGEIAHFVSDVPEGLVPGFEVDLAVVPDTPAADRDWLSPATDLGLATSVRALACPDLDVDALVEQMCERLPERGIAAVKLGDRISLSRPTWRLVDRRILVTAAELLDADVADPLVACLARLEQIRDAGQRTLVDPEQPEVIETFVPPGALTVSHGSTVTVSMREEIAVVRFRLDVTATLGETALVVRRGELVEVACQELSLSATLVVVGRSQPLWHCGPLEVDDVHLAPRPPVLVPLVGAAPAPGPRLPDDRTMPVVDPPTVPLSGRRPDTSPPGEPARAS